MQRTPTQKATYLCHSLALYPANRAVYSSRALDSDHNLFARTEISTRVAQLRCHHGVPRRKDHALRYLEAELSPGVLTNEGIVPEQIQGARFGRGPVNAKTTHQVSQRVRHFLPPSEVWRIDSWNAPSLGRRTGIADFGTAVAQRPRRKNLWVRPLRRVGRVYADAGI
jgi:hypothetical protein